MEKQDLDILKSNISKLDINEAKLRDLYLRDIAMGKIDGPMTGYASIDKPWLKYYDIENKDLTLPEKSIYQYMVDCNKNRLDLPAVDLRMSKNNFEKPIKQINYGQYIEDIVTIACGFMSYGIKPNEIVLQMLPNLIESRESIYACSAMGATPYPITPMLPETIVEKIIAENNLKNVIIYGDFYKKFEQQLKSDFIEHIIYLTGLEAVPSFIQKYLMYKDKKSGANHFAIPDNDKIVTWDKIIAAGKKYRKENKIKTFKDFKSYYEKDHIAAIVGTSGTTGISKGACLKDESLNAVAISQEAGDNFSAGEVNLDALIQSIAYGISMMHFGACGGVKNVIVPELVTDKIPMLLAKIRPDHFAGGPIHYHNIAKSEEFKNGMIKQPRNFISGGATLPKTDESIINNVSEGYCEQDDTNSKIYVRQGLGATENCGTGIYAKKGAYKFGGVGIPMLMENVSIFEPGTDKELKYNEVGEICLTGPAMMKCYLNMPVETAKVLKQHSDGTLWLHLEDLGYMDEDGQVYFLDRIKNIFMRCGFNVHPSKIEEYISSLPVVEKCAVLGIPHPDESCVPVAFVVLKDNANLTENEARELLANLCYTNLDELSNPYEWFFVKDLPTNLGGKVDANKLIKDNNIDYTKNKGQNVKKINLK